MLYVGDGVISTSGAPYWMTFDLEVVSIPTLAEGGAEAELVAGKRAYKGWSIICLTNNSYDSVLRLIPDGWEEGSGAEGSIRGNLDGVAPIKYFAGDEGFRYADTVLDVKAGDKLGFAIRIDPVTGACDVYIDSFYVGSSFIPVRAEDKTPAIRLWEGDGYNKGGVFNYTNVSLFTENYTAIEHIHSYSELIHFFDNSYSKYSVCDCGYKVLAEEKGFKSAVVNGLGTIYNGYGAYTFRGWEYWFVTDINLRGEVQNGTLANLGGAEALKIKDGKIMVGDTVVAKATYPSSYQVAFYIASKTSFDVYFNGTYVATMSKAGDTATRVVMGSESFGHHVRFMHNRAVILDTLPVASVEMKYETDKSVKLCYHESKGEPSKEFVKEANGVVTYSYICTKCGERVYAKLNNSLASIDNDHMFGYKDGAILTSELKSLKTDVLRTLYLENGMIGKNASPYWITFNLTPNSLPTLEGVDKNDPNAAAQRGYNLVSPEASFYPVSMLRVVPTESGAEIRIVKGEVDSNSVNFKTAVASLEVGKTVNLALYIDPATGSFDLFVDGEYKDSSKTAALADYNPKVVFHDAGMGEFVYSDIKVAREAGSLDNSVNTIELKAAYSANKTNPEGYTSLISIKRNGTKSSSLYSLLYVNNRTGELCFKSADGEYYTLNDNKGVPHKLSEASTDIAVVYDDNRASVRYYVGGKVPYYNGQVAMNIEVSSEFASAESVADQLITNSEIVFGVVIHGMEASGTVQVIGLQQKVQDDSLRIVAGIDIPWYSAVGYKVKVFDANGNAVGEEKTCKTDVVHDEIIAEGVMVPASKYGYKYFVPLQISDFVPGTAYNGYFITVTPFAEIGAKVLDGKTVRINVTSSGYEFAE